jgi:CRISPR-associated protein Cas1
MQLVLNKRGMKFSVSEGKFEVRTDDQLRKISVEKLNSILIQKSLLISSDAILLAIENEIDLVFHDNTGKTIGRIWSHKYGSVSTIRKNQVQFAKSAEGVHWIKNIILEKLRNQSALIYTFSKPDKSNNLLISKAIEKLSSIMLKIDSLEGDQAKEIYAKIRGLEGSAGKIYFEIINHHLPEQYRFDKRSQHPAFDMFNAMLNYTYGILYSKIEIALIKAGIDPYLGIMHRDEYNRPVLVYDVIEKYRIWADYIVTHLCMQQAVFIDFFDIEGNGVHYLNDFGKKILIQSFNDYLEDIITLKGMDRSREQHLLLFAQELAGKFKNFKHGKD